MFKKPKYVVGLLLIAGAFSYLVFTSFKSSFQFALTPSELSAKSAEYADKQVKISGTVGKGSMISNGSEYNFNIEDDHKNLNVHFKGAVPNTFREGADVVVGGRFDAGTGTFEATELLAKCASKYQAK
ncbi:MAG: cytochrome c biogenesis protein CcmE [Deltaproteobacteria bacterium CG11_big_fil_rev_8_21_14_0_20_49_13]|nr:MAG: cytochrome c biogenesis protein CcmE [Deltaproteobacteria bacterium CG11_big_fil_rev_8_21_14_0_20_49_13]